MTTHIVLDIEGTTSPTAAVHVGLYDYARPRLQSWIEQHPADPEVARAVEQTRADAGLPDDASTADVVAVLEDWMAADVKATPLKTLQGQIWAAGFAAGELTSTFFADVPPKLRAWHDTGRTLAVFSSGSIASQRPWFAHSDFGDLGTLISAYFDTTNAGPKREKASYEAITAALGVPPSQVLFLSDVPAELDAATAAGWQGVGVRRSGEPAEGWEFGSHPLVSSFAELQL